MQVIKRKQKDNYRVPCALIKKNSSFARYQSEPVSTTINAIVVTEMSFYKVGYFPTLFTGRFTIARLNLSPYSDTVRLLIILFHVMEKKFWPLPLWKNSLEKIL